MIPDVQREALAALAGVWALSPDVRLGQLFAHLGLLEKIRCRPRAKDIRRR